MANSNPTPTRQPGTNVADEFDALPAGTRSMLRIEVPLIVNVATKKQTIDQIVHMTPGTIITFDKSCDQMLELQVGDQPMARGQAVKVGRQYGIRVDSMIVPEERFECAEPATQSSDASC